MAKNPEKSSPQPDSPKPGLHPDNPLRFRYNFPQLTEDFPELKPFVRPNKYGDPSLDFTNPNAVKTFSRVLLKHHYGVALWDIPEGYLCPAIPGRADYIHHVGDLLAGLSADGKVPQGKGVRVLDIGVGANCIYPLIGHKTFGWSFVGVDVNPTSIKAAKAIAKGNGLEEVIQIRKQASQDYVLGGILKPRETFDLVICNPPFHASLQEALSGNKRKWKNLRKSPGQTKQPHLNFGGQAPEIWYQGGEKTFLLKMIRESQRMPNAVRWFTTLVSKKTNLPALHNALRAAEVQRFETIDMAQGQKTSRILAWTYL